MKAFVDSREPEDVKNMFHTQFSGTDFGTETRELPQADFYLPEYDVAIERKEASDFASSTTEGRLSEQADRMMAEHNHNFLFLENEINDNDHYKTGSPDRINSLYNLKYSNIGDNSIIGMQTSLAVKRNFKIIYTESVDQTVYAVKRVFERFADEEHEQADGGYVKTADTGEVEDVQTAMIAQIDGVSADTAARILDEISFSVIAKKAPEVGYEGPKIVKEELMSVDGVGEKRAERVINAFQ